MMMKQYDSYKDSGAQWIGKIPSHWDLVKLKYCCGPLKSGGTPKSDDTRFYSSEGTPWVAISDMSSTDFVYDTEKHLTQEGIDDKKLIVFPVGTILYSIYATLGKVSELKVPACINQAILALTPRRGFDSTYFKYCLQAQEQYVFSLSNGNTQNNLNAEKVANFLLVIPPLEEQKSSALYLDKKCEEIHKAIATQQKRIDLLGELRQNIITQAVTRGINPDAPLKDSGVKWIGHVPEHWNVKRIKHVITLLTDYDANGSFADIAKNCNVNMGEPYAWMVRATDLENKRYGIVDGNNYCDLATYKYLSKSSLKEDDILIAKRGDIGKSYLVPACEDPMTLAPNTYLLLTNKMVINNRYFYYYLQSIGGVENLKILNKSTTLGALYKDDVKAMQIPVPPIDEQQEIVSYIESKTASLDKAIEKANRQIELLQELKQSIITEVVTGKRKVC